MDKKAQNNPRVCSGTTKMMMSDYPGGVTLFPAKNPRPGPDPGGGRNNGNNPVVLGGVGVGGGGGGGGNTSLGQVQLNDRSCSQQQHPTYPGIHKTPATGRLVQPDFFYTKTKQNNSILNFLKFQTTTTNFNGL